MLERHSATIRYTLLGVLFGLLFPVFSTLFDLLWQKLPMSPANILWAHWNNPLHWVINTAPLFLGLFAALAGRRQDRLRLAHRRLDQQVQQLQALQADLEKLVAQHTADLVQRNTQLQTAARVAREAASIQEPGQLMDETVRLISARFGFYHAGIFLLDDAKEYALLAAASSRGGHRMLTRKHRLQSGMGIVGHVAARGEPRIALDVGADAVYFDNPDLPDTRSEMALPLRVRGEVIGILDVQSTEPAAFSDQDIVVLMTLADQVAVAINNAQLFEQAQKALEAQRRAYDTVHRDSWADLLRTETALNIRRDGQGISAPDAPWQPHMKMALREGRIMPGVDAASSLAIPLKSHGQVIGVIEAQKQDGTGQWAREEVEILETLIDRLGVTLESARLFQETQRREARERIVGQITTRMRETLDVDMVLQTAAREIGENLGLHGLKIRLADPDPLPQVPGQTRRGPKNGNHDGQEDQAASSPSRPEGA